MGMMDDPRIKTLNDKINATPTGAERNKLTQALIRLTQKIGAEEKQKLIFLNRMSKRLAEFGDINYETDIGQRRIVISVRSNQSIVKSVVD